MTARNRLIEVQHALDMAAWLLSQIEPQPAEAIEHATKARDMVRAMMKEDEK